MRCTKSPWMMMTPSLTLPPTPHEVLSRLLRAMRSLSAPMKPETRVTCLPPRPLRSILTWSFCLRGSGVSIWGSSLSGRQSGLVENTISRSMIILVCLL